MTLQVVPGVMAQLGDIEEPKVSDDDLACFQEDILGLEVFVYYPLGMKVAHPLVRKTNTVRENYNN